jgi:serine/threonine kinase 38
VGLAAELKKKPQPKRPSIVSLFESTNIGDVSSNDNGSESIPTQMDIAGGQGHDSSMSSSSSLVYKASPKISYGDNSM